LEHRQPKGRAFFQSRWSSIIIIIVIILLVFPLPYYVSQPGDAMELDPIIDVNEGYDDEGSFMLTTIRIGKANLFYMAWAAISDYRMIFLADHIRGDDETDEEYNTRQLQLMESSQSAATIVAYRHAGKEVNIINKGAFVTGVISGMSAADSLRSGDIIIAVNQKIIKTIDDLFLSLEGLKENDEIRVKVKRGEETLTETLTLQPFPKEFVTKESEGSVGIGITYPNTVIELETNPEISIDTNQIGGPSAGLMFALEIFNQLTEEDMSKGYEVAGTGTINVDGEVGAIGGIKQKVVAADNAEADIFFAPVAAANYKDAKEAAKDINTNMEIVPVEIFQDAVDHLKSIPAK
jgi:PDZ domain-containing protein